MQSVSPVSQDDMHGYTVAYEREEIQFPVYVVAILGAVLAAAGVTHNSSILIAVSLLALGFAYYNFPLLETGKPRIGASQYGIFAEGLGIIAWRSIKKIEMISIDMRGEANNELLITLAEPLDRALLVDWRQRPFYRYLMRLPWSVASSDVIRIPLDVFDHSASQIMTTLNRMMGYFHH